LRAVSRMTKKERQSEFTQGRKGGYGHAVTIGLIVLIAFAARYWFNFNAPHINNYGSCDASEYLRKGQALYNLKDMPFSFWQDCWQVLTGHSSAATMEQVRHGFAPLRDLYISGMTFPLFLAASYALVGAPFEILNWQVPVFAQSVLSALTCGLIALTAGLAFSRPSGYLAGLVAALYPAFIINSGRLYSETFAAFLLSAVMYLTVRGFCIESGCLSALQHSFLNGLAVAALQFTRSVMVIVSAALLPITFMQYGLRKGLLATIGLLIGFAIVALPSLAFQQLAYGSSTLVVDRVGNYNFFIGNNIDTAGWLSFPYPDGRGIDAKPMATLAQESIGKNPRRWLQLFEDKPLRLLKFPWNDFGTPIGAFTFNWQVLFHQLTLVLAFIGAALGFTLRGKESSEDLRYEPANGRPKDPTMARLFLLFLFCMHLVYLFFITVPRYNITAMPVIIVFCGAGIVALCRLLAARGGILPAISMVFVCGLLFAASNLNFPAAFATAFGAKATVGGFVFQHALLALSFVGLCALLGIAIKALARPSNFESRRPPGTAFAYAIVLAVAVLLFPLTVIPSAANGRWYEWRAHMDQPAQTISQQIKVPADLAKVIEDRQLYLMIDADRQDTVANSVVTINGKKIEMPVIPSISLSGDFSRLQAARGVHMREAEWIFACMTESADMKNGDLRQWFLIPLPADFSAKDKLDIRIANAGGTSGTIYGSYPSYRKEKHIPSLALYSWEKAFYGVENPDGQSDTRYETHIPTRTIVESDTDLSTARGLQTGSYNIRLLASPITFDDLIYTVEREQKSTKMVHLKESALGSAILRDSDGPRAFAISALPPSKKGDLWFVRVRGNLRRNAGDAQLDVGVQANFADKKYSSPWMPSVRFSKEWRKFDLAVPLEPSTIGSLKDLQIKLAISKPHNESNGPSGPPGINEFTDLNVEILKAPVNPLTPGHSIL